MNKKVVIAGSPQQYKSWCWENNITVMDAVCVGHPDRLRGMTLNSPDQVTFVGTWRDRFDIEEVMQNLGLVAIASGLDPKEVVR